jgi:hypothetical protein
MPLVNVNNQAMPMGTDAGQTGTGQTGPKRHFKHIGELADASKAKVVIVYRTVPDEPNSCLVVGTKFLPDLYHNSLMKAVESDGGQDAKELGEFLDRQRFPDGTNMLALLHNDNYIKKFATKDVIVTFGNTTEGRIALNKLNEQMARDLGVKVSELAVKDPIAPTTVATVTKAEASTTKKADAKKTTAKK